MMLVLFSLKRVEVLQNEVEVSFKQAEVLRNDVEVSFKQAEVFLRHKFWFSVKCWGEVNLSSPLIQYANPLFYIYESVISLLESV